MNKRNIIMNDYGSRDFYQALAKSHGKQAVREAMGYLAMMIDDDDVAALGLHNYSFYRFDGKIHGCVRGAKQEFMMHPITH